MRAVAAGAAATATRTLLIPAAAVRALLAQYLAAGADNKSVGARLLAAFERDDRAFAKEARQAGPRRARRKRQRRRALMRAAELGHGEFIVVLLRQGHADPDWADPDTGITPLILAAQHGHEDTVASLILSRADVAKPDRWGFTPLHYVAKSNRDVVVAHLARARAPLNAKDFMGRTALELALGMGSERAARALVSRGAKFRYRIPFPKWTGPGRYLEPLPEWAVVPEPFDKLAVALLVFASEGDTGRTRGVLDHIAEAARAEAALTDLERSRHPRRPQHRIQFRQTPHTDTPLFRCATGSALTAPNPAGCLAVATLLLDIAPGVRKEVDAVNAWGATALSTAVSRGSLEMVELLLRFGANVERVTRGAEDDDLALMPLHIACRCEGRESVIVALLDAGADIDRRAPGSGLTPLHICCWAGHESMAIVLMENGAHVGVRDNSGVTALMMASFQGLLHVVKNIVSACRVWSEDGDNVIDDDVHYGGRDDLGNDEEEEGEEEEGFTDVEGNAVMTAKDADGWHALRWGCQGASEGSGSTEAIEALLRHPACRWQEEDTPFAPDKAWVAEYVKGVGLAMAQELRESGLEPMIVELKPERHVVAADGDHRLAIDLCLKWARGAGAKRKKNDAKRRRRILNEAVEKERKERARGGKRWSLKGEVRSLSTRRQTMSAATSVKDLVNFVLPEIPRTPRRPRQEDPGSGPGSPGNQHVMWVDE